MYKWDNKDWLLKTKTNWIVREQIKNKFTSLKDVVNFWKEVSPLKKEFEKIYKVLTEEYLLMSRKKWNYKNFYAHYEINHQPVYIIDVETPTTDDIEYLKENKIIPYGWGYIKMEKNFNDKNEKTIYNYKDFYCHIDTLTKNEKWLTHNLSYDLYYYIRPLIDEYGYTLLKGYELEKDELNNKEIKIFMSKEKKIFYFIIKNNNGATIKGECSYLKIPFSVDTLGKFLAEKYNDNTYLKKELDYKMRDKNHKFSEKENEYIYTDGLIVKKYLNDVEKWYFDKMNKKLIWGLTLSGTAFKIIKKDYFKDKWNKYFGNNILKRDEWDYLKKAFSGGYTMYNLRHLSNVLNNIKGRDINSAHPDKMCNKQMPYGEAIYECKLKDLCKYNHFSFYEIIINNDIKIKEKWDGINFIQYRYNGINDYFPFIKRGNKIIVSEIKLIIFKETFDYNNNDVIINKTMCFKKKIMPEFKKYVNFWIESKNENRNNKTIYEFCKLMMNSVYGKFAQSPHETNIFFNDEWNVEEVEKNKVDKLSYIPVAIAIADGTRLQMMEMIKIIGPNNFIYGDTDSVYYRSDENIKVPVELCHNSELGKWDLMNDINEFKVIGKKKYIYFDKNGKKEIKCAGLPKKLKDLITIKEFNVSYSVGGKKARTILFGMPLIGLTTYTIKNMVKTFFNTLEKDINLCPDWYKERLQILKPLYFVDKTLSLEYDERENKDDDILTTDVLRPLYN